MHRPVDTLTALLVVSRALEKEYSIVVLLQPPLNNTYQLGVLSEYAVSESNITLSEGLGLVLTNDEHGFTVGESGGHPIVTVTQIFEIDGGYTVPRLGIAKPKALYPIAQIMVSGAVFDAPQEQCVQIPVEETSTNNNGADVRCPPSK